MPLTIGPVKQNYLRKNAIIFLSISLNMCFGCTKEPSNRDGSFEYSQHMFTLRNKKNNFQYAFISGGLKSVYTSCLLTDGGHLVIELENAFLCGFLG